ncbi:MAG: ABC transporter permease, partial [Kiritimatiellae bacterium]|nr:ABC transporter permease [Kiritimatiellia bacterium]
TPIIATRKDGVYRHILGTVVAASGVGDLLFPVLLGGLVIFGTMLGSVADREKEIYTFSALGLAPPHVASLFFAEAMVYSVIGGLGGYLIAQGSMKILGFLATYGWVQVPVMNYSSTNAIVTILIVMATVLVSAIYPAVKASKSANPGLLRSWKLPQPEGDVIDLVFPFTVSEYDLTGVVSFLKEHFEAFSDTGLGSFMAQNTKLIVQEDGSLGVATRLAIAPFDLGVTQDIFLKSAPSEIPGIDEVNIRLTRCSGQPKDWARLNKVLLNDLRTQFLLWRSLPVETMEIYRQRTLAQIHEMKQDPA